ncbi:rhombotarget lipoprotein [uncultured Gilvimarinus sp.]|uniref:rhombotarget lipoprotein n=1 Tax=uncultured Gilvimarinus sp. TaxID=1689143 RepID=UPI0030DCBF3D
MIHLLKIFIVFSLSLLACSCSFFNDESRTGVSSSLVDYLYPDGEIPSVQKDATPHLKLPLTVGLAFIPSRHGAANMLPEAKKTQLLTQVKQKFSDLNYVRDIVVIPDTYMRSSKGFAGIDQIARLYNLDVIALVSYDQVAISSGRKSSLLYWTIVGSYVVKGSKNQATTFVDTAVFDVNSRKILFRAPGISETQNNSTLVEMHEVNRETREEGFKLAMNDMSINLASELEQFKKRVKQDDSVKISHHNTNGGGGAIHWSALLMMLSLALLKTIKDKRLSAAQLNHYRPR